MYQPLAEKGINGKQSQKLRFWGKAGAFQGQLTGIFFNGWIPTHQKSPSTKSTKIAANLG